MTTFRSVNNHAPTTTATTTLNMAARSPKQPGDETTPTTPRPANIMTSPPSQTNPRDSADATTPTRHSFGGVPGQKALPTNPPTVSSETEHQPSSRGDGDSLKRADSQRSKGSGSGEDVEMGDADDDLQDASDNDSNKSDSERPSKKKKGQRFFCTEFPPCNLSFTRSEHLARHIRKHTGERPFQCHCSRRFSRLDNLRQHAQTVHINEEIPGDSLAATGTRFQRQIRTDRVRPPTHRSRGSSLSMGSATGPRGHSRNLSTSSIASTASTISTISTPDASRRKPAPLAMASDPSHRGHLSIDTFASNSTSDQGYQAYSPNGFTTPTSATFSTGGGSPFAAGLQSPISIGSRPYHAGARTPGRRLSVPSAPNPFQSAHGQSYPPTYFTPGPSGASSTNYSPAGSLYTSPTATHFAADGRADSLAEAEWRRRTWHPGTYGGYAPRPTTSGLTISQTPEQSQPSVSNQPAASQQMSSGLRLPGIESFDHAPPPHRSTPMEVDDPSRRPMDGATRERPNSGVFEPLGRDMNRMAISNDSPGQQGHQYQPQAQQSAQPAPAAPGQQHPQQWSSGSPYRQPLPTHPQQPSGPSDGPMSHGGAFRETRRQGWYAGPPPTQPRRGHAKSYSTSALPAHSGTIHPSQMQSHYPPPPPAPTSNAYGPPHGPPSYFQSPPQPMDPSSNKRSHHMRTSPEDSSSSEGVPTPGMNGALELRPAIVQGDGHDEPMGNGNAAGPHDKQQPQQPTYPPQAQYPVRPVAAQPGPTAPANDLDRLQTLVDVATNEANR